MDRRIWLVVIVSLSVSEGYSIPNRTKIVGGYTVGIEEVPYQVAILVKFPSSMRLTCGGSILSVNIILTAAHCVNGGGQFFIRAGSNSTEYGGQLVEVAEIRVHPQYDQYLQDYDVAMLKLKYNLIFGNTVAPILLANSKFLYLPYQIGRVTGWGTLLYQAGLSERLQAVEVPVVNQLVCDVTYSSSSIVTDRMFCAGFIGTGGKDACQGDSGGPFVIHGYLAGVVSWGAMCADPQYPGVYANVFVLREWIGSLLK